MTLPRALALLLVVSGLVAGTFDTVPAPVEPRQAGGYHVLDADFHVHAFPGDGMLAPWILRREVQRRGIEVFALTNHNQTFVGRFAKRLAGATPGPMVIVGQEVTARTFHISAVGIDAAVDAEQSAVDVIRAVQAQGGIAIANHPESPAYTDGYDSAARTQLDGFERAHPVLRRLPEVVRFFAEFETSVREVNPGIAYIGSSDFHGGGWPGWCRTYVLARERSEAGVLDAIRAGRTVAADTSGQLYGRPEDIALVREAGGYRTPSVERSWLAALSGWAAWLGLVALLVLSPERR